MTIPPGRRRGPNNNPPRPLPPIRQRNLGGHSVVLSAVGTGLSRIASAVTGVVSAGLSAIRGLLTRAASAVWSSPTVSSPSESTPETPTIYANACGDSLEELAQQAIESATQGIVLRMHRISSPTIIKSLVDKANEEVHIDIECQHYVDPKTKSHQADRLKHNPNVKFTQISSKGAGLHEKVMVVDGTTALVSTANFSETSLQVSGNLTVSVPSEKLCRFITNNSSGHFEVHDQWGLYFSLPKDGDRAFNALVKQIRGAKERIQVAMLSLSYHSILRELEHAFRRGVDVEVIVDKTSYALCMDIMRKEKFKFPCYTQPLTADTIHYKMCIVDNKTLIVGSTNWTFKGFRESRENMLILGNLTEDQREKLQELWDNIRRMCRS